MTTDFIKLNELVGKIKNAYLYAQTDSTKAVLEDILPELKESEDEKIRKALIKAVSGIFEGNTLFGTDVTREEALVWLEKQESVGEIVERCKTSWYNEGKIQGQIEGLSDEEKYQQGWHDALEEQGQEARKVSIWKHWKDGIAGNGNGEPIFLIKNGNTYTLSSVLSYECDYIELSELNNLMLEKQGEQKPIINVPSREVILAIWDLGNEWKELTNGSISTEYGTQLYYIQKHWHESEYYLQKKQGEQKSAEWHKGDEQNLNACLGYIPDEYLRRWLMDVIHVKYDKPTDKVESKDYSSIDPYFGKPIDKQKPKFHEGDWVILFEHNDSIYQVERIDNYRYYLRHYSGYTISPHFDRETIRLWTIKDAKPGDVLYSPCGKLLWIYKDDNSCYVGNNLSYNENCVVVNSPICIPSDVCPATKEQRDLLFQKMKEEGYEWSDKDRKLINKKELKKIEQKPADNEMIEILRTEYEKGRADAIAEMQNTAWSEEDELHIRELENLVKQVWATAERENDKDKIHKMSNLSFFLKTLKPQLKQEWSKDDEAIWTEISDLLWEGYKQSSSKFSWDDIRNWVKLKFLKHQYTWKPSEEQLDALQYVYRNFNPSPSDKLGWNSLKTLELMYHDLKKLKE